MAKAKYGIVIDTNIIKNSNNEELEKPLSPLGIRSIFDFIKKHKLEEEVVVIIPEIVLEELLSQKIYFINKELSNLDSIYQRYNKKFGIDGIDISRYKFFDFYNFFMDKCLDFIQKNNIDLLKIPDINMNDILRRCLQKQPPFGIEGDKGFKDTILWLSIVNLAKNNPDMRLIFATADKIFRENFLNEEIKIINKTGIRIHEESNEIVSQLSSELEVDKRFKDRIDKVKNIIINQKMDLILTEINKKGYTIRDSYSKYVIQSYEFKSVQFIDIKEEGDVYTIISNLSLNAKYIKNLYLQTDSGLTPQASTYLQRVNIKVIMQLDVKSDDLIILDINFESMSPPYTSQWHTTTSPFIGSPDYFGSITPTESYSFNSWMLKK